MTRRKAGTDMAKYIVDSSSGVTGDEAISIKQEVMYSASCGNQAKTLQTKQHNHKKTPLNRFVQPTRCRTFQSIFHYVKDALTKTRKYIYRRK